MSGKRVAVIRSRNHSYEVWNEGNVFSSSFVVYIDGERRWSTHSSKAEAIAEAKDKRRSDD